MIPLFKDLKLIEAWGSGIQKIKKELAEYPEIELVLHEVGHAFQVQFRKREMAGTKQGLSKGLSPEQCRMLENSVEAKAIVDLMKVFNRTNRSKFKNSLLQPLIDAGFIEMTEPNSPNRLTQKYRTTEEGLQLIDDNNN